MANFASIKFSIPTPDASPLADDKYFICLFDGVAIYAKSAGVNNYSLSVRSFANNPYDSDWPTWGASLMDCLQAIYIDGLNYPFTITLGSDYIELVATEYGHAFSQQYVETMIPNFSPYNGVVTAESQELLTVVATVAQQAPTDRNNRVLFRIEVDNYNEPCHINNIPIGATQYFSAPYCYLDIFRNFLFLPPLEIEDSLGFISNNYPFITPFVTWSIETISVINQNIQINAMVVSGGTTTTLTYSIDGAIFQNSNTFTGVAEGDYTAYILDSLGGLWSKTFTVYASSNRPDAFIDMSDINSLQCRDSEIIGTYKALWSKQKRTNKQDVCAYQLFKNDCAITEQIRTSYENISVLIDGLITSVCTKVIENIGQIDWRDCAFADGGTGKSLVYFQSGNVYDPSTGDVISTYNNVSVAGLLLEDWQKEGIVLSFTFGEFDVVDTVYSSLVGGMCLVINTTFLSFAPEICKSNYNKEAWDVWEFGVDMGVLDQNIEHQIEITFTDSQFPTKIWNSEPFYVTTDEDNELVKISAYGEAVISDMVPTGIVHTIYLPATFDPSEPFQESEAFDGDTGNSINVKQSYDQGFTLATHLITPYMLNKLNLLLMYKNITIDDDPYSVVGEAKTTFMSDKFNPLVICTRNFRPNKTAINYSTTEVTARVLGVSNYTVLGA